MFTVCRPILDSPGLERSTAGMESTLLQAQTASWPDHRSCGLYVNKAKLALPLVMVCQLEYWSHGRHQNHTGSKHIQCMASLHS